MSSSQVALTPQPDPAQAARADGILFGVTFLAGLGWIFSKEAVASWPPLLFIGLRFLLASLILVIVGWRFMQRTSARNWLRALVTGGLMSLAMVCWVFGLSHATQIGVGAFLACFGVLLVPVVGWFMYRQRSPLSVWLALLIALIGVVCLAWDRGFDLELAHIWFLLSALLFAILFNLNTRYAASLPVMQLVAIQLAVVGAVNMILSLITESWPQSTTVTMWGWFFASVLIATSLRFFLQIYAQGQTTASRAALVMMMEPVWTAVMAALWYGETMSRNQLLGCSLIFLALIVNRWRQVASLLRGKSKI